MEKLSFQVNEYYGPLDLILALISKHQLDIVEVRISDLLEQYLAAIQQMEGQNLEVASEFLEMASRLVYIKTVSLLPKYEEEAEEARQELVGQLLEYQAAKDAAAMLGERNQSFTVFIHPPEDIPVETTYNLSHSPHLLAAKYWDAVGKGLRRLPPKQDTFAPLVAATYVSVPSRVIHILRQLYKTAALSLKRLFGSARSRSELVADFLAVLQLAKGGRIRLEDQDETIVFVPREKQPRRSQPLEGAPES